MLPQNQALARYCKCRLISANEFKDSMNQFMECSYCYESLNNNCVLYDCECLTTICETCALTHLSKQPKTYMQGAGCLCKEYTAVEGVDTVAAQEFELIQSSFTFFKVKNSENRKLLLKVREALKAFNTAFGMEHGFGKFPIAEQEVFAIPEETLTLARMEYFRQSLFQTENYNVNTNHTIIKKKIKELNYNQHLLPLGPLVHIKYRKNMFLHKAIERINNNENNKLLQTNQLQANQLQQRVAQFNNQSTSLTNSLTGARHSASTTQVIT